MNHDHIQTRSRAQAVYGSCVSSFLSLCLCEEICVFKVFVEEDIFLCHSLNEVRHGGFLIIVIIGDGLRGFWNMFHS